MDRTITTDDQANAALDGWMSFEELAEERWERVSAWSRKPIAPAGIAEHELPF
ncbi:MAG: hypothetical protein M0Z28_08685 [Rhodospirillales bacterium]|nr:hypothetical protein [Rhodospirillales bacterium]